MVVVMGMLTATVDLSMTERLTITMPNIIIKNRLVSSIPKKQTSNLKWTMVSILKTWANRSSLANMKCQMVCQLSPLKMILTQR